MFKCTDSSSPNVTLVLGEITSALIKQQAEREKIEAEFLCPLLFFTICGMSAGLQHKATANA